IGLSKYSQEPAQTEGRTVLHNFRFGRISQLSGFSEGIVKFTKAINQLILERVLPRQDSAVRDGIAQEIGRKISFLRDDAEKLVVSFHNETLHKLAFLRRDRSRPVKHVLKLAAFKNDGSQSNLVEQLLVVQRLNDHADATGDLRF